MTITIEQVSFYLSQNPATFDPNKTTIIFLHDSLGCTKLWKNFPDNVSKVLDCNVLCYDRQGYGQSAPFSISKRSNSYLKTEAEVLGVILKKLELSNVILYGHSDGGSIALLAAGIYPEKIKAIITEGAHVFVEKETIRGIKEAQTLYQSTNLKEKLYNYHGDKTEMVFNMWVNTWLSQDYQSWNIEKYLPLITCPSLIIQGELDEYGTVQQVDSIINQVTGETKSLMIPNVRHSPHKEAPEIVINAIKSFIKE